MSEPLATIKLPTVPVTKPPERFPNPQAELSGEDTRVPIAALSE
jgi:hypothetical protein